MDFPIKSGSKNWFFHRFSGDWFNQSSRMTFGIIEKLEQYSFLWQAALKYTYKYILKPGKVPAEKLIKFGQKLECWVLLRMSSKFGWFHNLFYEDTIFFCFESIKVRRNFLNRIVKNRKSKVSMKQHNIFYLSSGRKSYDNK